MSSNVAIVQQKVDIVVVIPLASVMWSKKSDVYCASPQTKDWSLASRCLILDGIADLIQLCAN